MGTELKGTPTAPVSNPATDADATAQVKKKNLKTIESLNNTLSELFSTEKTFIKNQDAFSEALEKKRINPDPPRPFKKVKAPEREAIQCFLLPVAELIKQSSPLEIKPATDTSEAQKNIDNVLQWLADRNYAAFAKYTLQHKDFNQHLENILKPRPKLAEQIAADSGLHYSSRTIEPIQRFPRYNLFLEEIRHYINDHYKDDPKAVEQFKKIARLKNIYSEINALIKYEALIKDKEKEDKEKKLQQPKDPVIFFKTKKNVIIDYLKAERGRINKKASNNGNRARASQQLETIEEQLAKLGKCETFNALDAAIKEIRAHPNLSKKKRTYLESTFSQKLVKHQKDIHPYLDLKTLFKSLQQALIKQVEQQIKICNIRQQELRDAHTKNRLLEDSSKPGQHESYETQTIQLLKQANNLLALAKQRVATCPSFEKLAEEIRNLQQIQLVSKYPTEKGEESTLFAIELNKYYDFVGVTLSQDEAKNLDFAKKSLTRPFFAHPIWTYFLKDLFLAIPFIALAFGLYALSPLLTVGIFGGVASIGDALVAIVLPIISYLIFRIKPSITDTPSHKALESAVEIERIFPLWEHYLNKMQLTKATTYDEAKSKLLNGALLKYIQPIKAMLKPSNLGGQWQKAFLKYEGNFSQMAADYKMILQVQNSLINERSVDSTDVAAFKNFLTRFINSAKINIAYRSPLASSYPRLYSLILGLIASALFTFSLLIPIYLLVTGTALIATLGVTGSIGLALGFGFLAWKIAQFLINRSSQSLSVQAAVFAGAGAIAGALSIATGAIPLTWATSPLCFSFIGLFIYFLYKTYKNNTKTKTKKIKKEPTFEQNFLLVSKILLTVAFAVVALISFAVFFDVHLGLNWQTAVKNLIFAHLDQGGFITFAIAISALSTFMAFRLLENLSQKSPLDSATLKQQKNSLSTEWPLQLAKLVFVAIIATLWGLAGNNSIVSGANMALIPAFMLITLLPFLFNKTNIFKRNTTFTEERNLLNTYLGVKPFEGKDLLLKYAKRELAVLAILGMLALIFYATLGAAAAKIVAISICSVFVYRIGRIVTDRFDTVARMKAQFANSLNLKSTKEQQRAAAPLPNSGPAPNPSHSPITTYGAHSPLAAVRNNSADNPPPSPDGSSPNSSSNNESDAKLESKPLLGITASYPNSNAPIPSSDNPVARNGRSSSDSSSGTGTPITPISSPSSDDIAAMRV